MKKLNFLKNLRGKLMIYFFCLSILPLLIVGIISYNFSTSALENQAKNQLSSKRESKGKEIKSYFERCQSTVSYIAQDEMLIDAMNGYNKHMYKATTDKYRITFNSFLEKFNCDDFILFDANNGDIVYSAKGNTNFGNNILTGEYRNSNLAAAFLNAKNSTDKGFTDIEDFQIYKALNNKAAMFIGAPIYEGNKQIGVICVEILGNRISNIVSENDNWGNLGLGKTGEIVLFGSDYTSRNDSRFLKDEIDPKIIMAKSDILLKKIDTEAAHNAIMGQTYVNIYKDYRGVPSIIAYSPLKFGNIQWGLAVKISEAEAFESSNDLGSMFIIIFLIVSAAIIVFSTMIAFNISKPIKKMSEIAYKISNGDLTVESIENKRNDEIGVLSEAIGIMLNKLKEQTKEITEVVNVLASSTSQITASLSQVSASATETSTAVSETTATVEEVKQTVDVSNQKTREVSNGANKSVEVSQIGMKASEDTIQSMKIINNQMEAITQSVVALSEKSQDISELISTVDDISEQSNLLAVNASIEAAKAGDQGKGFGIVAQEIRNLALQSKQATKQVRSIIKDIQKATSTAVMTTEQGAKAVESGIQQAIQMGEVIQKLTSSLSAAANSAMQIEASSQQQLIGMDQVAAAMEGIKQASIQNVDSMRQLEVASKNLQEVGQSLKVLIDVYKI